MVLLTRFPKLLARLELILSTNNSLDKFGYYDSNNVGESKVLFQRIEMK